MQSNPMVTASLHTGTHKLTSSQAHTYIYANIDTWTHTLAVAGTRQCISRRGAPGLVHPSSCECGQESLMALIDLCATSGSREEGEGERDKEKSIHRHTS